MKTRLVKERGKLILEVGTNKRHLMKPGDTLCKLTAHNCTIRALKQASKKVFAYTDSSIVSVIKKDKFENIIKDHGLFLDGT